MKNLTLDVLTPLHLKTTCKSCGKTIFYCEDYIKEAKIPPFIKKIFNLFLADVVKYFYINCDKCQKRSFVSK